MSRKRCCCDSSACGCGCGCGKQTCFGNICNPFCLVVLLIALRKGEVIQSQSTIEALFFLFLLLCCCNNGSFGGFGSQRRDCCC
ncbi:hypothetical protein [Clostridium sp. KNHs214]|uniref:hypothetical protein n=1 Tax=Clostridium sp. KNHs214 TaxID=1540257 RepID=UPI0005500A87|nr:hypothetical protein [Clostridium sp. KNHs214]